MSADRRTFIKMSGVSVGITGITGCNSNLASRNDERTENDTRNGDNGDGGPGTGGENPGPTETPELTDIQDIYNNIVWEPAQSTVDAIRRTIAAYEDRRFDAALRFKEDVVRELSRLSEAAYDEEITGEITEEQAQNMREGIFQLREANTFLDQAESFRQDSETAKYEQKLVQAGQRASAALQRLPKPEDLA